MDRAAMMLVLSTLMLIIHMSCLAKYVRSHVTHSKSRTPDLSGGEMFCKGT